MVNGKIFGVLMLLAMLALSGTAFASINPKVQLMNYTLSEVPAQPEQHLATEAREKLLISAGLPSIMPAEAALKIIARKRPAAG